MASAGLAKAGLQRLHDVVADHVDRGDVPGVVWGVQRRGQIDVGTVGTVEAGGGAAVAEDSIFRISSMTKPVTAVAAMILVEECRLRLDDPVDDLLPELADRQVIRTVDGAIDDTLPADRPITLRDVLTFRLGWGYDFTSEKPQTVLNAIAELGLGVGPPAPDGPPEPDEWIRRLGTMPLMFQPGTRWLYHTGADVLGVLVARAAGQPFPDFLRERIFEPLGMRDTAFWVPPEQLDRFGPQYAVDPATGARSVYDSVDGQWSHPPAFPGGGAGLVSTLDDYLAFAEMLLGGGVARRSRILSRPTVETMTINQLDDASVGTGPAVDGALGWGFGMSVQVRRLAPSRPVGSYGWDGGLGTSWCNDPSEGVIGVLLTNQGWPTSTPPALFGDFWTSVYAAIDD
jgi:CubicO group peptidase (beta-lactamase class C family)